MSLLNTLASRRDTVRLPGRDTSSGAIGLSSASLISGAIFSAAGAFTKSLANKRALKIQAQVAARNVQLAEVRQEQAKITGRREEATVLRRARSTQASQRAGFAKGGGLNIEFGTPLDILADVQEITKFDLDTIKLNTANRLFDIEIAKQNATARGDLLSSASDLEHPGVSAFSSLLGSGANFELNRQQRENFARGQTVRIVRS